MAIKKTGMSRDLIIHPGETIADVLKERGITQAELAAQTGVTPAFISNVISGNKDISANFAFALEYALNVPKSFWLNLQANYDAELLEANEEDTITDSEYDIREELADVVRYLRKTGKMPGGENKTKSILSLRKALQISNIANLKDIVPTGAFRMAASQAINPYVLGAWIRLCQITGEKHNVGTEFAEDRIDSLVLELKKVMRNRNADIQNDLKEIMAGYGIDFSVVKNFRGAPVQGYISLKSDGVYRMILTIRGAYADIFWFSLFHELGHIMNGDVKDGSGFIDYGCAGSKEKAADLFAVNHLIDSEAYRIFISDGDYSAEAISAFSRTQNIMPFIVIGRLQKEGILKYYQYSELKIRYVWAE